MKQPSSWALEKARELSVARGYQLSGSVMRIWAHAIEDARREAFQEASAAIRRRQPPDHYDGKETAAWCSGSEDAVATVEALAEQGR